MLSRVLLSLLRSRTLVSWLHYHSFFLCYWLVLFDVKLWLFVMPDYEMHYWLHNTRSIEPDTCNSVTSLDRFRKFENNHNNQILYLYRTFREIEDQSIDNWSQKRFIFQECGWRNESKKISQCSNSVRANLRKKGYLLLRNFWNEEIEKKFLYLTLSLSLAASNTHLTRLSRISFGISSITVNCSFLSLLVWVETKFIKGPINW